MSDQPKATAYRSDYLIGFHDGIKAALNAAGATYRPEEDGRDTWVRASIIEKIGEVKPYA